MGNYPNDLAEWLSQRKGNKSTHAATMASFLAVSENVRAAIDAGFELKTIWEHLREKKRISFRYETFLKYVRRHITKTVSTKKTKDHGTKKTAPSAATAFSFSPNPKKDELL